MGLPSQKRSKSSKLRRASHFAITKTKAKLCEHCQTPIMSHRACANCGYYKGKMVLKIKTKIASAKGGSASGRKKKS